MVCVDDQPKITATQQKRQRQIVSAIAEVGFCLPGSVVVRHMRCGTANCRCRATPPQLHGPYHQWTRKVDGKTVTRWLKPEEAARYESWFANARRLRELATELETLSLDVAQRAEGWEPQPPPKGRQRRGQQPRAARSQARKR